VSAGGLTTAEMSFMPTLTIDDLTLDVIGTPSWRDGGPRRGRPRVAAFIAAQVSVPSSVATISLNWENAHVVLTFDDGSKVEGRGMRRTGSLSSDPYVVSLLFEGDSVVQVT
jgi:hypothetical protein